MKDIKNVSTRSINLSIEPKSHVIVIEQGDNQIKVTKDQVNDIRMLRDGVKYKDGVFTTSFPSNRFEKQENGSIVCLAVSETHDGLVTLNKEQVDKLVRYMDKNRPYITWTRDLMRKPSVY